MMEQKGKHSITLILPPSHELPLILQICNLQKNDEQCIDTGRCVHAELNYTICCNIMWHDCSGVE